MDSKTAPKFSVILTLTFLLYGLTALVNSAAPVDDNCPCRLTQADMQAAKLYDICTGSGTFKSKTACYVTPDNIQRAPYQFYTCAANGGSYLLYPRKCPGPLIVVNGPPAALAPGQATAFFNAYNPSTGQCDLVADPAFVKERTEPLNTPWSVDC